MIVWNVERAAARETLDRPRRRRSPDSRSAATAGRSTAPPGRHGPDLGSRRRPPPRPPVRRRDPPSTGRADRSTAGKPMPCAPTAGPRRRATRRDRQLIDAETLRERSRFRAVPNAPVRRHGVRAGRAVARRRRRRGFPRHLRTRPAGVARRAGTVSRGSGARARCSRPPSAPTDGSWRPRVAGDDLLWTLNGPDDRWDVLGATLPAGCRDAVAQPRRTDAGRRG